MKLNRLTHPIANVLIKDFTEYEITSIKSIRGLDKSRALKLILLNDNVKNIKNSKLKRVDVVSLRLSINKKKKMYESFKDLKIMNEASKKQFEVQKKNLLLQIRELEAQIGELSIQGDTTDQKLAGEVYEFKNHIFCTSLFGEVTLCHFCSKALPLDNSADFNVLSKSMDLSNYRGLKCRYCNMVTHKGCFSHVRETCEFFMALQKGLTLFVNVERKSDKESLFGMLE